MKGDRLLYFWILIDLIWGVFIIGGTAYLVFWKGQSAWWFALAVLFTNSSSLFKALRKRFGVPEDEEEE